jgi:hypothetical protein
MPLCRCQRIAQYHGWIHGLQALSPQLKFAWAELAVIERLFPSILTSPITNPCCGELPKRAMKFYLRWLKTWFIHSLKIVLRDTQSTLCRNNAGVLSRSFCKNAMLSFSSANVSSCRNLVKEHQLVS